MLPVALWRLRVVKNGRESLPALFTCAFSDLVRTLFGSAVQDLRRLYVNGEVMQDMGVGLTVALKGSYRDVMFHQ